MQFFRNVPAFCCMEYDNTQSSCYQGDAAQFLCEKKQQMNIHQLHRWHWLKDRQVVISNALPTSAHSQSKDKRQQVQFGEL